MFDARFVPEEEWPDVRRRGGLNTHPNERHLYLLQETGVGGQCKIGVSVNAFDRCATLQVGNPRLLEIRAIWVFRGLSAALRAEADVLDVFAENNTRGEWFIVPPGHIIDFMREKVRHATHP